MFVSYPRQMSIKIERTKGKGRIEVKEPFGKRCPSERAIESCVDRR